MVSTSSSRRGRTRKPAPVGEKFGRMTVLGDADDRNGERMLRVSCDCGREREVNYQNCLRGKSSGCSRCAHPIGTRIGAAVLVSDGPDQQGGLHQFRCDCGKTFDADISALKRKSRPSCGCMSLAGNPSHHQSKTDEYRIWGLMKNRCQNPNSKDFHRYGGRGIVVCDAWARSFEAFFEDMGPRPSRDHSIDRIDNDRGYEPGNVRWALPVEQANNRRSNRVVEIDGSERTVADWARHAGITAGAIQARLGRGVSADRLLLKAAKALKV